MEIALARHCGPNCIITPISKVDEAVRTELGFRGPQNFRHTGFKRFILPNQAAFGKHMPVSKLRAKLPASLWNNYRKFTIVRNPFDRAVSRYFWDVKRGRSGDLDFDAFYQRHPHRLTENMDIAPLDGPDSLDIYLRYEHLEEDLTANDLGFLWDTFRDLRAKSGHRPAKGGSPAEMFSAYPRVAELIQKLCRPEIDRFNYSAQV